MLCKCYPKEQQRTSKSSDQINNREERKEDGIASINSESGKQSIICVVYLLLLKLIKCLSS